MLFSSQNNAFSPTDFSLSSHSLPAHFSFRQRLETTASFPSAAAMALGLGVNSSGLLDFSTGANEDDGGGHSPVGAIASRSDDIGHNGHHLFPDRLSPVCTSSAVFSSSARNKRKNFKPRNILPSGHRDAPDQDEDDVHLSSNGSISHLADDVLLVDERDDADARADGQRWDERDSACDKWSQRTELLRTCFGRSVPNFKSAVRKTNAGSIGSSNSSSGGAGGEREPDERDGRAEDRTADPHLSGLPVQQHLPLDLSQSDCRLSPPASKTQEKFMTEPSNGTAVASTPALVPSSLRGKSGTDALLRQGAEDSTSRTSLGFWRPALVSGIAPWIDPSFLSETGAMASKIDALQRSGAVDYTRYVKRFANAAECGAGQCRDLNYREHFHCLDCNSRVFVKKEEMIRHFKWHKKRDESLQHGFMRYSPCDDCSRRFPSCAHNRKQTHYHCLKRGCDKCYISTSDVQMHANYHRKDTAIIQEGFQRFRATEDCLTNSCPFQGQKTTHFHCRRNNCNFTFKNKADMEKHKSFHIKDEQLTRDGFKKFTKHDPCHFDDCRFSRVCNHIHCIRSGCNHVFHSSGQLYSHKRKHEKSESEPDASPGDSQSQIFDQQPPPLPPPAPVTETYPTGTTLTSIDGLPVFKRKRGRPPKNQVPELPVPHTDNQSHPFSLPLGLSPFSLAAAINGAGLSANYGHNSSASSEGLIPVPMLPILQLFNLPTSPTSAYSMQSQTSPETMDTLSPDEASADGDNGKRLKVCSGPRTSTSKDDPVPDGYLRFRFNEDCGYPFCGYREHQTHFHCMRKACGYSFCDKTRFSQHTARHERLDTLMGQEFQQFRSNVNCGHFNCTHSGGGSASPSNKASHFHCLKCDFVCTDTNRVVAHRRQHHKMDSINAAGFDKYTPSQDCAVASCPHNRKQTHYHCLKCQYAVLGLSQMSSHKYKHAQE